MSRRSIAIGVPALAWLAANAAQAQSRHLPPACALPDRAAVEWIEAETEKRTMAPALLAEAALAVLRARNACLHGQLSRAFDLYEGVRANANGRKMP